MSDKTFSTAAVVSATTGRLAGDFGEMQELLSHVHGRPVFTHELPRAAEEAEAPLRAAFPWLDEEWFRDESKSWLAMVRATDDRDEKMAACEAYCAAVSARVGESHKVPTLEESTLLKTNPIETAVEVMGAGRVMVVSR